MTTSEPPAEQPPAEQPAAESPPAEKPNEQPMSPTRSRQEKKREENVANFDRQVDEGSVVIRQMTKEEREANPPRERPPKRNSR